MDFNVIIEGDLKFRDRRKWKNRWCVVRKLSPVADCLHLQLYRDSRDRYKQGMTKASLSLEHFLGTESGFTLDKESNTVAIVCRDVVVILAFDSRERLIQWQMKINYNLGESTQFLVQISSSPIKAKLTTGPARMHIQNNNFCVTSSTPPKLLGYWEIKHLRRYGIVDGRFCFEGGSLCGRGEGLYIFLSDECEDIVSSMRMASQGKLLPKKRHTSRNMSVIESPRRYMQRTSESLRMGPSSLPSAASNGSCQSFAVYEWASTISNVDTVSEGKYSSDYLSQAQSQILPDHWLDFGFDKLTNELSFDRDEATYEPYVPQANVYADMKEFRTDDQFDDLKVESENRVPERPPKPTKKSLKSVNDTSNTVIKSSHPLRENEAAKISNENISELKKPCDDYDVPQTFSSNIQPKSINDHTCACTESKRNCTDEQTIKKVNPYDLYDVPPVAMPVNTVCSCTSKMRVIVESEECFSHKHGSNGKAISCPCQHIITCWPYNWLQLAYCRRGNTIQDSPIPFKMVDYVKEKAEIDPSSLYAQVDLSKKLKNKVVENPPAASSSVLTPPPPPRPTEPKPRFGAEANNSYTNLYFENTLKYYENARELIKNTSALSDVSAENRSVDRCCKSCSVTCAKKQRTPANYIVMNPVCAALQQLEPVPRHRSDSLGSTKSAPISTRQREDGGQDSNKLTRSDTLRSTKAGCAGNRDSSSSNDSGFSFGSLKGTNGEIQYQPLVSRRRGGRSNSLKSSEVGALGASSDLPTRHRGSRKDGEGVRVEGISSIPFIDSQSTSSETSDISDYIETLSLSSHSSSDNSNSKAGAHHPASTILRPRSGKEYEKVNRVLLQRRADDQEPEAETLREP